MLFSVEEGQEELLAIGPSGFVSLDNRLEGYKGTPASLNLTILIIIDGASGFSQRQLKSFPPDRRHLSLGSSRAIGG